MNTSLPFDVALASVSIIVDDPLIESSNSVGEGCSPVYSITVVTASVLVWFTRIRQADYKVGIQDNVETCFPTLLSSSPKKNKSVYNTAQRTGANQYQVVLQQFDFVLGRESTGNVFFQLNAFGVCKHESTTRNGYSSCRPRTCR